MASADQKGGIAPPVHSESHGTDGTMPPLGLLYRFCRLRLRRVSPLDQPFFASPSGKMILFTKKKITMETPPFSTVVPML